MCPVDLENDPVEARAPRDNRRENRVEFAQVWAYAYAGTEVVRFFKGEIADVSDACLAVMEAEKIKFSKSNAGKTHAMVAEEKKEAERIAREKQSRSLR